MTQEGIITPNPPPIERVGVTELPGGMMAVRFSMGYCDILVSEEPGGLHLSISTRTRYPNWEEIKRARYKLLPPDRTYAIMFPPMDQYVNVHPNCFHLYELPSDNQGILGMIFVLKKAAEFVDCCDAEGLTKPDDIAAMQSVVAAMNQVVTEKCKEMKNG